MGISASDTSHARYVLTNFPEGMMLSAREGYLSEGLCQIGHSRQLTYPLWCCQGYLEATLMHPQSLGIPHFPLVSEDPGLPADMMRPAS